MPNRSKKLCYKSGCRELTTRQYCEKHEIEVKQRNEWQRGNSAERGYDHKWRKARKGYLLLNPYCVECKKNGDYEPSTVVDHIEPHKGDQELFWNRKNWQALCASCHSIKTAKEDGGYGNYRK